MTGKPVTTLRRERVRETALAHGADHQGHGQGSGDGKGNRRQGAGRDGHAEGEEALRPRRQDQHHDRERGHQEARWT
jgi:hypothetical protein